MQKPESIIVQFTVDEAFALIREGKTPEYMNGSDLVAAMAGRKKIEKAISRGIR